MIPLENVSQVLIHQISDQILNHQSSIFSYSIIAVTEDGGFKLDPAEVETVLEQFP
jgi:hypothetical protein